MARQNVPGTVWKSHGAWHWKVKFPDETKRRDVVLTFRDRLVGRGLARVEPMRPSEDERRRARRIADGILPRVVGDRWDTHAYARAIARVCEVEGIAHWSPNQLRHTCAPEVRRRFGLAAARAVLGHSCGMRVTDRYSFEAAEDEALRDAIPAMLALG